MLMDVDDFEVEHEVLHGRMANEVMHVFYPFISFVCAFIAEKAHNMLAFILDPRFKGRKCVTEHVGVVLALEEYDNFVLLPLVVEVSQH